MAPTGPVVPPLRFGGPQPRARSSPPLARSSPPLARTMARRQSQSDGRDDDFGDDDDGLHGHDYVSPRHPRRRNTVVLAALAPPTSQPAQPTSPPLPPAAAPVWKPPSLALRPVWRCCFCDVSLRRQGTQWFECPECGSGVHIRKLEDIHIHFDGDHDDLCDDDGDDDDDGHLDRDSARGRATPPRQREMWVVPAAGTICGSFPPLNGPPTPRHLQPRVISSLEG